MAFNREAMKQKAAALAATGVFVGTSSWKYEGWLGQLYTPARYEYRGKVAKTRFERNCLPSTLMQSAWIPLRCNATFARPANFPRSHKTHCSMPCGS